MAPATENAVLPLKPDVDLTTGPAAETWRSTLSTIGAQPGCQRIVWGRSIENPENAQMLIDWDDISNHKTFIASPAYGPFLSGVSTLLAAPPALAHHRFATPLAALTSGAPVTELVSFYFPAAYSDADFAGPWDEFAGVTARHAAGLVGSAGAWGEEEVEHASLGGEKGRVFLAAIAWESVDAHMAYRETAAFKESIVKLRALVSGIEMHHVDFKEA
ncbi:hypothetical protein SLS56_005431 [Neofusicoccum ribis]|uniref:ABM domain-containing protein n=1 Tax=Neofusicoccum ribis TaxID=45134 RepID=A0ABR3SUM2_9PEZI